MAHIARSSVAVVGKGLNYNGDARRTVALVHDLLVVVRIAVAGSFLDNTVYVVVGNVVCLSLGNDILELRVRRRIGAALTHRNGYLAADLREDLRALVIRFFFLSLDRTPF